MSNEDCRTRPNGVLGKPRVYINCTLPGQSDHFDTLAQNILDGFDCQVRRHVISDPEVGMQLFSLAQMYVIPVTREMVDQASFFNRDSETLCRIQGIPALVILCNPGLDGLFAEQFDGWRYLDRTASDGSFLPALHALLQEVLTPAGPGTGDDRKLASRQCFQLANDLFEQGQMDQAEQYYQSAFHLLAKVDNSDLSMPEYTIVMSCSKRLQRFAAEAGRQDDAAGHESVVDAYNEMITADPRYLQMEKDDCAILIRNGDHLKKQGILSLARSVYEKCVEIYDANDYEEQLRVFCGQALLRLGELDQQAGDGKRARERFEQALPLLEEQAQSGEKDAPLDLIRCSIRLGDLAVDQLRFQDAQDYYRQCAQLLEQHIQRTGSDEYLDAYIAMCTKLGQVSQEMDEPEEALRQFSHALDFTQRLSASADADPSAVQLALCACYEGLGDICARQEDHENASQYFVKLMNCAVKLDLDSASGQYNLAHSYDRLAKEELALGQLRFALDHCTAAQKVLATQSDPDHQMLQELSRCLVLQAKVWRASRQMGQAQPLYEKAVQTAEQAVAKHDSHSVRECLAYAYQEMADFCWATDRISMAREYDEKKRAALKAPAGKK